MHIRQSKTSSVSVDTPRSRVAGVFYHPELSGERAEEKHPATGNALAPSEYRVGGGCEPRSYTERLRYEG